MKKTRKLGPGDDREMILSPDLWPRWPILPLKHTKRKFEDQKSCGFLIEQKIAPFTVYLGFIWGLPEDLNTLPTEQYDTLDALLEDWRVD